MSKELARRSALEGVSTVPGTTGIARAATEPRAAAISINWRTVWLDTLLVVVLLAGAYLRFVGLNWDDNQHLHPDERFLTMVETSIAPVQGGLTEYFDTEASTLNPYNSGHSFFVYGTAPIFFVRYTADLIHTLRAEWLVSESTWRVAIAKAFLGTPDDPGILESYGTGYEEVHLVGRAISGLADLIAVWILYLTASRLYRDKRIGLLAATLSAFAVLQIQQSHFFTVDAISNVFVVASLYFAVRALDDMRWRNYLLFGLSLGLSVASRINTAPLGLTLALAAFAYLSRFGRSEKDSAGALLESPLLWPLVLRLGVAALVSLFAFRIGQPYAFEGPGFLSFGLNEQWLNNMREIQSTVSGDVDFPPNHQWTDRTDLIFPFENMVRWGMGLALGLIAWAGFALAAWQILRGRWQRHLIPVIWTGLYFGWQGTQWVKPMRYFLPVYPTLILLAAWLLIYIWDAAKGVQTLSSSAHAGSQEAVKLSVALRSVYSRLPKLRLPRSAKLAAAGALIAVVILFTAAWAFAFSRIYTRPVTRVAASEWIYQNIPGPVNLRIDTAEGEYQQPISIPYDHIYQDGQPHELNFRARFSGTLKEVYLGHLGDPASDAGREHFLVTVAHVTDSHGSQASSGVLNLDLSESGDPLGSGYIVRLEPPLEIIADETYRMSTVVTAGGPISIAGTSVINESSWDDGLPLRIGGYDGFGGIYTGLNLELYWDDNQEKLTRMLDILEQGDYIFISSNRQYGSIPRLPLRYPLTVRYYEALFSGELGFDLVYENESAPSIGPIVLSDQDADEPFTVYDHPKVLIFQKSSAYSSANTIAILSEIDLSKVIFMNPYETTAAPTALLLPDDRLEAQRNGGTWSEAFNPSGLLNSSRWLGVLAWWELGQLMGWVLFPLTFLALRGLPDRGYAFSKTLAILATAWVTWILSSVQVLSFTGGTLWLIFLLLGLFSVVLFFRRRTEMMEWLRKNWRYIVAVETVLFVFFAIFLFIRWRNPDLWHPSYGGEKPMDFSYFNAVLRSSSFPPYDPWFAGGYINYYYFGFVVVAVLTKMLGIVPAFAYNLILPFWFGLTAIGAFGLSYNLVAYQKRRKKNEGARASPYIAGITAAIFMVFIGNLGEIDTLSKAFLRVTEDVEVIELPVIETVQRAVVGLYRIVIEQRVVPIGTGEWYWNATRIIPAIEGETGPITEFPFFTFLYADLHAHLIVLPLALLAIAWAMSAALRSPKERGMLAVTLHWIVGGLAIGVLGPTNTWDLPTYLSLGVVAIAYAQLRRLRRLDFDWLVSTGWRIALLVLLANLFFRPFSEWFGTGYGSIELWEGSTTPILSYLKIHGLFLFLIVTFLLVETRRWMQETTLEKLQEFSDLLGPLLIGLAVFAVIVLVLWLQFEIWIAPLVLPLILWTALLMIRPAQTPERRALFGLVGLGLTLTLAVELVRLEGDIGRMNTVFKFYLQVWTVFSIAAGAALAWVWPKLSEWRRRNLRVWKSGLTALVVMGSLYTILAASAKMGDRMAPEAPATLDGLAYMKYARYHDQGQEILLAPDYDAIRWLQDNVIGSPVIVEVNATEYKYGSRFTINTGLPGVVGWNWHQRQQRSIVPSTLVTDRVAAIDGFYRTMLPEEAVSFINKYEVKYVIVGGYERAYYGDAELSKFDELASAGILDVAYRNDVTVIYEVLVQ